MIIPFDGYRVLLMVEQTVHGSAVWKAIVLEGFRPCAVAKSVDPLRALAEVTMLYHEAYLTGKESVRKHYFFGKPSVDESSQGPSAN